MTTTVELKALTLLRTASLTADMDNKHLKKLAAMAQELELPANEIIYQKGSTGRAIYLIEQGQVVIETNVPGQGLVAINKLGPGQFFGWSSLFPTERKMAWTRTTEPTRLLVFDAERIRAAWQSDHELEYALVRRAGIDMTERIISTRLQLIEMLAQPSND